MLTAFLFSIGAATNASAQEVSVRAEPATAAPLTCGPSVQLPTGSKVVRLNDALQVTLPHGYVFQGMNPDGVPQFVQTYQSSPFVHGPAAASSEMPVVETIYIDCQCNSEEGGTCAETYNTGTGEISCTANDCSNCFLFILRLGEE